MNECEREALRVWGYGEEAEICASCVHFRWHYIADPLTRNRCTPIFHGHCVYPRVKDRSITDTCEHFERG